MMCFGNRTADGQPQPRTGHLAGAKRFKDLMDHRVRDTRARVGDDEADQPEPCVDLGRELDSSVAGRHGIECLDGIAQEVEQIVPDVVSTSSSGEKSVNYGSLVGLLIETIKEQNARIQALEARLAK